MRKKFLFFVGCLFFLTGQTVFADTLVKPYTFSNNTIADAEEVNANFDVIINQMNKFGDAITVVSGKVGIGTTLPAYALDVRGNRICLQEDASADWIAMRTDGSTLDLQFSGATLAIQSANDGENIVLNPFRNCNVGIGSWNANYTLDVDGNINFTGNLYQNGVLFSGSGTGSTGSLWTESDSDIFRSSGKVGIGTSSPAYTLDVKGDRIRLQDTATTDWISMRTDGSTLDLQFSGATLAIQSANDGENIVLNPFRNCNVGIGSWNANYTLDVDGNINFTGTLYQNGSPVSFSGGNLWTESGGSIYRSSGKVGIGTSSPAYTLDVKGDRIHLQDTATTDWIAMRTDGSTLDLQFSGATLAIQSANDGENIVLNPFRNCNVGIGSWNANYPLDVDGNINTTGSYLTNGSDYAEYFESEEILVPGDIVGINPNSGLARKYLPGDELIGIVSVNAAVIGNNEPERSADPNYVLVGLLGQLDFNETQTKISGRIVKTKDGKKIGFLLKNKKVFIK